ncbi:MAG: hypothetical protein P8P48_03825 [Saprospiraceae bacterium]|nr:hypothetical protein [Saprospiraceae bacterium]
MMKKYIPFYLFLLLAFGACTPKTAQVIQEEDQVSTTEETDENLSPCKNFEDAFDPDDTRSNYIIYKDYIEFENYEEAFELWNKVYKEAPAADGKRNDVFTDGVFFYERLALGSEDSIMKAQYIARIFSLYEEAASCYPETASSIKGQKAFDLFFKYPDMASKFEIYQLFKEALDEDQSTKQYFVLNPFTSLLVDVYNEGQISKEEALEMSELVQSILKEGLETCSGKSCESWKIIEGYVPQRLEAFETIKGFYDCEYYINKYYSEFLEDSTNCEVIQTLYIRLSWAECATEDTRYQRLVSAANDLCVEDKELKVAYNLLKEGAFKKAIDAFIEAEVLEETEEDKSKVNFIISKIYYAHLKNFPLARKYALKAAKLRPNWGEPYLLIGRLYASSGPLCGPGTGWDSQIVVWPALDKWNYAKKIDPSVSKEANKLIGQYARFMPSKEDLFFRTLQNGQSFRVGCWIQENTKIRTSD